MAEEKNSVILKATVEGKARFAAIVVDPRELATSAYDRIATGAYPPVREGEVAALLTSNAARVEELAKAGNLGELRGHLWSMERQAERLESPPPQVSAADELRRCFSTADGCGWSTEEWEGVKLTWHDGDRIRGITAATVTLGERVVERAEIRGRLALPAERARFLASIEARAVELETENQQRRHQDQEPVGFSFNGLAHGDPPQRGIAEEMMRARGNV